MELLALSVGLGLVIGLLFTEIFGIATGGLIVPGYMALAMSRPQDILVTLLAAFATFGVVRALSTFLIIYGRRRTALMILIGYLMGMIATQWPGLSAVDYNMIGFIIPGLIAIWMDRQGPSQTMASLAIVSIMVRLILILAVGQEVIG